MQDLGKILKYIQKEYLYEDDNLIQLSFGDEEILLFVTEHEYPIRIHKVRVFNAENAAEEPWYMVAAELYAELLRSDILWSDLERLTKICKYIEENDVYFLSLLL